jgi:ABC-type sugar transport system ATPase subunit
MAQLAVEHLSKAFRSMDGSAVWALRDFTLALRPHELLALVGPSGCGKTTLLRLIAGLEEPDAGRVLLEGQSLNPVPPQARDIAMVFQRDALYPHMTVRENLSFGLKVRKCPRAEIERRVAETAGMLGLGECLEKMPHELSGGFRQRTALGRALVRKPKVLLLDEPLSHLDAPLRAQLREEIKTLHRRLAATVIYVTHDQAEALGIGDRVAVMRAGALEQVDTAAALGQRPASPFVAEFLSPARS